jgi:hypothetical protein
MAEYTRDVHEEYAVQRWPETKRLLGLLVNSSGAAHARNARRLVHAARKQDRRLAAALLAAALAHAPEAEEVLRGARTRMARKPPALARELLRNFPKRRGRSKRRRRRGAEGNGIEGVVLGQSVNGAGPHLERSDAGGAARVRDSSDEHGGSREAANAGASAGETNHAETSSGETANGGRRPAQRRSRRRVPSADGRSSATSETASPEGGERDRSAARAGEQDAAGLAGEPALD